jgi:hypothetical protein
MKLKVLAYITRNSSREVLVFDHRDKPQAGVQVPAGTVDEGEDIITNSGKPPALPGDSQSLTFPGFGQIS